MDPDDTAWLFLGPETTGSVDAEMNNPFACAQQQLRPPQWSQQQQPQGQVQQQQQMRLPRPRPRQLAQQQGRTGGGTQQRAQRGARARESQSRQSVIAAVGEGHRKVGTQGDTGGIVPPNSSCQILGDPTTAVAHPLRAERGGHQPEVQVVWTKAEKKQLWNPGHIRARQGGW